MMKAQFLKFLITMKLSMDYLAVYVYGHSVMKRRHLMLHHDIMSADITLLLPHIMMSFGENYDKWGTARERRQRSGIFINSVAITGHTVIVNSSVILLPSVISIVCS